MGNLTTRRDMRRSRQANGATQRGKRLIVGLLAVGVTGMLTLGGTSAAFAADGTTDETTVTTDVAAPTTEPTTEATTESTPEATTESSTPASQPEPETAPAATAPEPAANTTPSTESAPAVTTESAPSTAPAPAQEPATTQSPSSAAKSTVTTESSSKGGGYTTPKKVYVCKYVGTPGVDEVLKSGKNPISVSVSTLKGFPGTFPWAFADAQGNSIAIAYDNGQQVDASACPKPDNETPEPPAVPEPKVTYGDWTDGEIVCDATTVEQTRTVTTTPYKVMEVYGEYKVVEDTENVTVTTETQTRDLTKDEQTTCPPTEEPTPGSIVTTCTGATVTYPTGIADDPYGNWTEVNIYVTNLNNPGDGSVDFNYYDPFTTNPSGETRFYDLSVENPGWPGWTWYEITKVTAEPGGQTWTGSIICGEESTTPEPPVVPEPNVVYGDWTDETIVCDTTTVEQTRTVTTTPYKVVLVDGEYQVVLDTENATVTTETRTRDLTSDEQTTCPCDDEPTTPPTPPGDDTPTPPTPVTPVTPSTPVGPLEGGYFNTGDTVTAKKESSMVKVGQQSDDGQSIVGIGAFVVLMAAFGLVANGRRRRKANGTAE